MRFFLTRFKYMAFSVITIILLISTVLVMTLLAADDLIKWRKQDTMDTNLNIVENKAGDDDILLEMSVEENGTYNLSYYLENGYKTSIDFVQAYEDLSIEYHILQNDGAGGSIDVTQDRVSESYLEINYDLDVPDWEYDGSKTVGSSGGLEYSIERSASNEYPGIAIDVDNMELLIMWDFSDGVLYALIKDYESGKIMPVEFTTPDDSKSLKVLKNLEGFEVSPTHYYTTDGAYNIQLNPVSLPSDDTDTPGSRPGMDISFKQPMEMNATTWQYSYVTTDMSDIKAIIELEDVGGDGYFDFTLGLQDTTDLSFGSIDEEGGANDDAVYLYDTSTYTYTIHIVKDKSDLAQQDTFIQWSELAPSSIYNVNLSMEVALSSSTFDDYGFTTYQPSDGFGYTYMSYVLTRSNAEEAYLDVIPYNVGEQEEIEYTILYSKTIKETLDIDEDLWLNYYHSDDEDEIFIPVPFRSTSSQDAYQVVVTFSGVDLYSQVLNYRAVDDDDIPPTTPTIETIENLFVVPTIDESDELPEIVKFDLEWSAPTNEEIKELDTIFEDLDGLDNDYLYYEVSVNDLPTNYVSNPFETVKVFVVTKEGDNYVMDLYEPKDGSAVASETVNYDRGYNETDELFRMDDIIIRTDDLWSTVLETTVDEDSDIYTVTDSGEEASIVFPGINYIRVKAIAVKDGDVTTSDLSIPVSLSLSMQTYQVPTVDVISYEPLYSANSHYSGITLNWDAVDISTYESRMLEPLDKVIEDMRYTVYISEEKSDITLLDITDSTYIEKNMTDDENVSFDEDDRDNLRDGHVLYYDLSVATDYSGSYEVDMSGLDSNETYYISIVTKVNVNDETDIGADPVEKVSEPSGVLSATTPVTPEEPGDDEVVPLAPENVAVSFADESEVNALIEWYMPEELTFEDDAYGFEVFSVVDRSMPSDLNDTDTQLLDLIENDTFENDVVEGWRIYVHDGVTYLKKYDAGSGAFIDYDMDLLTVDDNNFDLIDDDNAPNRVNYYYVRSIKITDETTVSASAWVAATLTTSPVQAPINLIVDYETVYNYETKNETVIRFDAPISDVSSIGSDYIIEVHVKGEDDNKYSTSAYPARFLGSEGEVVSGYLRLSYLVTDLSPGDAYDIKVRIEDRTQEQETLPDGSTQYPKSSFSNVVTTRTDFDQENYDKENIYKEYLDYYLDKAEELKLTEYFRITNTTDETALKYRESYLTGMTQLNRNSELELYGEDKSINTYYIPSNSLELVNDMDVTLVISSRDQLAQIRPNTVGVNITDEIDDMIKSIAGYDSNDEDYYLRIRFYTDIYNGKVNGSDPSSELIDVELAVVGSEMVEKDMDDAMVDLLDKIILSYKDEVIDALEEELEEGIDESKLLEIVQDVLEDVRNEYVGKASLLFKGYLNDNLMTINSINKNLYLGLMPDDESLTHDVYTKVNGSWQFASSTYYNSHYFVETEGLQSYLTIAQGDSNLAVMYGQETVDMLNAYDLTSVFSEYDLSRPEEKLDKYQWINALARLIGARTGEDTADYLEKYGIHVSAQNLYGTMENDESLYLYAQVYAYKYHMNLESTYIADYYAIKDIEQVDETYRQTLLQAANLDILPIDDGYISPGEELDMALALTLLTDLHLGVY